MSNPAFYDRYSADELRTRIANTRALMRLPANDRGPATRELAALEAALDRKFGPEPAAYHDSLADGGDNGDAEYVDPRSR